MINIRDMFVFVTIYNTITALINIATLQKAFIQQYLIEETEAEKLHFLIFESRFVDILSFKMSHSNQLLIFAIKHVVDFGRWIIIECHLTVSFSRTKSILMHLKF